MITRAAESDYPIKAIVEMAIAGYLDPHAIGFAGVHPSYANRSFVEQASRLFAKEQAGCPFHKKRVFLHSLGCTRFADCKPGRKA